MNTFWNKVMIVSVIISIPIIAMFFLVQVNNGHIEITFDQADELAECEAKLEECEVSITPNCSPCECKGQFFYNILWIIYGMILGTAIGTGLFNYVKKKEAKA